MSYLEPWRYLPVPSQNIHSGRSLSREDLFVELELDHKIVHLMAPPNNETNKKKNTWQGMACYGTYTGRSPSIDDNTVKIHLFGEEY